MVKKKESYEVEREKTARLLSVGIGGLYVEDPSLEGSNTKRRVYVGDHGHEASNGETEFWRILYLTGRGGLDTRSDIKILSRKYPCVREGDSVYMERDELIRPIALERISSDFDDPQRYRVVCEEQGKEEAFEVEAPREYIRYNRWGSVEEVVDVL